MWSASIARIRAVTSLSSRLTALNFFGLSAWLTSRSSFCEIPGGSNCRRADIRHHFLPKIGIGGFPDREAVRFDRLVNNRIQTFLFRNFQIACHRRLTLKWKPNRLLPALGYRPKSEIWSGFPLFWKCIEAPKSLSEGPREADHEGREQSCEWSAQDFTVNLHAVSHSRATTSPLQLSRAGSARVRSEPGARQHT
jgi:hypothetical protein